MAFTSPASSELNPDNRKLTPGRLPFGSNTLRAEGSARLLEHARIEGTSPHGRDPKEKERGGKAPE